MVEGAVDVDVLDGVLLFEVVEEEGELVLAPEDLVSYAHGGDAEDSGLNGVFGLLAELLFDLGFGAAGDECLWVGDLMFFEEWEEGFRCGDVLGASPTEVEDADDEVEEFGVFCELGQESQGEEGEEGVRGGKREGKTELVGAADGVLEDEDAFGGDLGGAFLSPVVEQTCEEHRDGTNLEVWERWFALPLLESVRPKVRVWREKIEVEKYRFGCLHRRRLRGLEREVIRDIVLLQLVL